MSPSRNLQQPDEKNGNQTAKSEMNSNMKKKNARKRSAASRKKKKELATKRNNSAASAMHIPRGNAKAHGPQTQGEKTTCITIHNQKVPDHRKCPRQTSRSMVAAKSIMSKTVFRPSHPPDKKNKVLVWNSSLDYVPLEAEEAMCAVVYLGKAKERGMLRDQTQERIAFIIQKCTLHKVNVHQACSLRRHHILRKNKMPNAHEFMGLGTEQVIRKAAEIFEDCVAEFLKKKKIPFLTEADQKRIQPQGTSTPDCLLKETVLLKWKNSLEIPLNWVECKMFFGASTIPLDNKSAVGRILSTADKYVKLFGPGAICFRDGCGDQLALKLRGLGVIAVDADAVNLVKLEKHDRRWCSDRDGNLLP